MLPAGNKVSRKSVLCGSQHIVFNGKVNPTLLIAAHTSTAANMDGRTDVMHVLT